MEGLNGVIFVEALHYFPFILLNLSASLSNIDSAMEESAQNLGAHGFTLFRRIVFPLALPGYVAGAALVFVKVFDDLATPLLLNVTNMLAPQAYLKITSVGITDPMGYVISVIMIICSVGAMALAGAGAARAATSRPSSAAAAGCRAATLGRGGNVAGRRASSCSILLLVLSPHIGIFLLSIATVWSYAVLPDGFTLAHYADGVSRGRPADLQHHPLLRARRPDRRRARRDDRLCGAAHPAARPPAGRAGGDVGGGDARAWCSASACCAPITTCTLPFSGESLATFWVMLVIAYAVRRLPYALSAATAALQPAASSAWRRPPRTSAPASSRR